MVLHFSKVKIDPSYLNTMHILQLEKTTHHSHTELVELDSMRAHMVTLAAHLDVKADQYLQFMEWKKGTSLLD